LYGGIREATNLREMEGGSSGEIERVSRVLHTLIFKKIRNTI
jgi:hypothetical protein